MLKMKSSCEACQSRTGPRDTVYICSYECTFCQPCTESMSSTCPNCGGELVRRPRRDKKPLQVAASQIKSKLSGKKSKEK